MAPIAYSVLRQHPAPRFRRKAATAIFVVERRQAVFAPADMPAPTIERLNAAIGKSLQTPTVKNLADQSGIALRGGSPQQWDALWRADDAKWGRLIRDAGIKA
jgi:tripartite-type tricarboxylate transporter receptor subunit TctC